RPGRISVAGHAGYAPSGQDIVCAAVSALTLTLIQGLEQVAGMEIKSREVPGNICIEWQHMNDTGKALIDTWFLGICAVEENYNCIQFV
ncbi:MAG: ribosomal-processing cysteine protease Prp, partial [Hungatella sp.]